MNHAAAPWRPLGRALLDVHSGDTSAELVVSSDLWENETVPAATFYRPDDEPLPELERQAVELARGRVLDLGAGAGRHALELQRRGLGVVALDLLDEAVEVMRGRGVSDARHGTLDDLADERFDTVLMLMHGLGVVGDLHGLGRLLEQLPELLTPDGCLICDSADLTAVLRDEAPEQLDHLEAGGRYPGEVTFRLGYRGRRGPSYPWLFVDPETLSLLASAAGFDTEVIATGKRGAYLARLHRSPGDGGRVLRPEL